MLWKRVEKVLKEKDVTIYEVTKKAGISQNTIYNLKSGQVKDLNFNNMCKIADVLEVSLDEFREK